MNPRINAFQSDAGLLSCDQCYISLVTSDYCHVAFNTFNVPKYAIIGNYGFQLEIVHYCLMKGVSGLHIIFFNIFYRI